MVNSSPKHTIFLHLPKNGGTTFHQILERFYKKEEVFTVQWIGEKGNLKDFSSMSFKERSKIKLLKGHFDFGLHNNFLEDAQYITFLRDPESRIISFYYYVKRSKSNRLYQIVEGGNMSFKEFLLLGDKDCNNGQIRKLSGLNTDEESMLNQARKNISSFFPVVGIQEMFDESLIVLAHHFSWPLTYYRKLNVSKNKRPISREEREMLVEKNQGDSLLYSEMKERLQHQIKDVPYFKLKLLRLKAMNFFMSVISKKN